MNVIWLLFLASFVIGTEVCQTCRPVELQNGPGLGMDLTMAYGVAAIKFRNGTIKNVIKIDGSPEYVSAMRRLAIEAVSRENDEPTSLPAFTYETPLDDIIPLLSLNSLTFDNLYSIFIQRLDRMLGKTNPPEPMNTDAIVTGISGMILELKAAIREFYPSLSHSLVIVSVPDFMFQERYNLEQYFSIATKQAGFAPFGSVTHVASGAALEDLKIRMCWSEWSEPIPHCDDSRSDKIDVVLAVTYNSASFGITILSRDMGALIPARNLRDTTENIGHGAGSALRRDDPDRYWAEVQSLIEAAIKNYRVDYLMLLGAHTRDSDLLRIVGKALDGHISRGRLLGSSLDAKAKGDGFEDEVFHAARGAAIIARKGMPTAWDACLVPDWCPRSDPEGGEKPETGHWIFDDQFPIP